MHLTDGGSEDAQSSAVSGAQNRYDDCSGVQCPELDCPTRPYIPQGECCPICPGIIVPICLGRRDIFV